MCERNELFRQFDSIDLPWSIYEHLLCRECPCPGETLSIEDLVRVQIKALEAQKTLKEVQDFIDQEIKKRLDLTN